MRYNRKQVKDHSFVSAVTIGRDGADVIIGSVTASGRHTITIPAEVVAFIRERL